MVHVVRLPLATMSKDGNSDDYIRVLRGEYKPFQLLDITEHTLSVDENGTASIISIDEATPAVGGFEDWRPFKP